MHQQRVLDFGRYIAGPYCAALLAEGWDQPSIKTMILARPTKSLIRYIQMAGRILRPFEGKDKALILDEPRGFAGVRQHERRDNRPSVAMADACTAAPGRRASVSR